MIYPRVIFEDTDILVLDKPSGWITNSSTTTTSQPVVQNWVRKKHQSELTHNTEKRDGIVHRLDKETSGLLIVARTKIAFDDLQRQFKERLVQKAYTALVHGNIKVGGLINEPVGRLPWRRDRFGVLPGGRQAVTEYEVISRHQSEFGYFSLLRLKPQTGRTHQIRIHLKHINHPIVSDEFYAGRKTARDDRKWCPRLFLHANQIEFAHPATGEIVKFKTPLPQPLAKVLARLPKIH